MAKLDVGLVKESTIKRLYENGFDTLDKILKIKVDELVNLEGFQLKSATKIIERSPHCGERAGRACRLAPHCS